MKNRIASSVSILKNFDAKKTKYVVRLQRQICVVKFNNKVMFGGQQNAFNKIYMKYEYK